MSVNKSKDNENDSSYCNEFQAMRSGERDETSKMDSFLRLIINDFYSSKLARFHSSQLLAVD